MTDRIVGKNALESLTTGMYKDPRIIYREYIQNAADAIDQAVRTVILKKEDNKIEIKINQSINEITISDNGTGIPTQIVYKTLGDIGVTTKDYTQNRGFRGIGRLGGLGYCDELLFITSSFGEKIKTISTWDCKKLKQLLRPDNKSNLSVIEVVNLVTNESIEPESVDSHYFKVVLRGVNNEKLLDFNDIKDYLSQSAPVCFNYQQYSSLKSINENLILRKKEPEEYNVFLNNEQIFKPYRRKVTAGKEKEQDFIKEIKFFDKYKNDGSLFFMGWYGITDLSGSIKDNDVNGIRVRKHNILIGDNSTLDPFFGNNPTYQTRNRWYVGEIYVYEDNLIPNARRDDFEQNNTYFEFKKAVEETTRELGKLPHEISKKRSIVKKVKKAETEVKTIKIQIAKGITDSRKEQVINEIEKIEQELKKVPIRQQEHIKNNNDKESTKASSINQLSEKRNIIIKELEQIKEQVSVSKNYLVDQVSSRYPREVRNVIRIIFEIIDKELPQKDARSLQEKIINELKK